jgi:hypothetical protein
VLPKTGGDEVTRNSIKECTKAIRGRYGKASKEEKGKILDEFTKTVGLHRKSVIRLLHRPITGGIELSGGEDRRSIGQRL